MVRPNINKNMCAPPNVSNDREEDGFICIMRLQLDGDDAPLGEE